MSYNEFVGFLERFIQEKCEKLYYCQPDLQIPEGLTLISNELEYQEFIDIVYQYGVQVPIYMEHFGTIVHVSNANENEIEDNCYVKSTMSIEREEGASQENGNEEVTEGDPKDDEDDNVPNVKGKPIFNEDIPWKKQLPVIASWMSEEQSFQTNSLIIDHTCARNFKLGSIVNYRWIGSHFTREIFENHKFNVRMLKGGSKY
uniref:Uncharacterized protein n=1 Tax=Lactuca sativa TaxID=4236 RepID=A0A9R1WP28_LACSA|nr:hypothetical protein LSAT_V11C900462230 [Lactuca sativa]